jgi:hypothetical protein
MKIESESYTFSPEGHTTCTLVINGKTYKGEAFCHERDKDMLSEKVGHTIAHERAYINFLADFRDGKIVPTLDALKQFYYTINKSKKYNKNSYESRMLQRQIRLAEEDLATIRSLIAEEKQGLKDYINYKEVFYQRVRKKR